MIRPFLETRAEIKKYYRSFFGSNENKKICFWNLLTFRSDKIIKVHFLLGTNLRIQGVSVVLSSKRLSISDVDIFSVFAIPIRLPNFGRFYTYPSVNFEQFLIPPPPPYYKRIVGTIPNFNMCNSKIENQKLQFDLRQPNSWILQSKINLQMLNWSNFSAIHFRPYLELFPITFVLLLLCYFQYVSAS